MIHSLPLVSVLALFLTQAGLASEKAANASFDCRKARATVEKRICANESIAQLDRLLGSIYQTQLKSLADSEKPRLKNGQAAWLKQRDACVGELPSDEEICLEDSYVDRIIEIGGANRLLQQDRERCRKDDSDCTGLGMLEVRLGKWSELVTDLKAACVADHDGDGGQSCYRRALGLEKSGNKTEAQKLYAKTCSDRQVNEACAGADRLSGKKSANPWVGLYKNDTGTVWVSDAGNGKLNLHADTHWANGHLCEWTLQGTANAAHLTVDPDPQAPDCKPVVEKQGDKLIVQDPGFACKNSHCGERALYGGEFIRLPQ